MTIPPDSRADNLAIWAVLFGAILVWQVICLLHPRLPSFGDLLDLLRRWLPSRWALLGGWLWWGWHSFVRGSW